MSDDAFFERQLSNYKRAWRAGSFPDLIKAFVLCTENGRPLADWTADEVLKMLTTAFETGAKAGKRGQGGPGAIYKYNKIHNLRWSWASYWLTNRKELKHFGYKPTRNGAFDYTSKILRGTLARGSPEVVEDSYKLVEKAIKRGEYVNFDDT